MLQIANAATQKLAAILASNAGVPAAVATLAAEQGLTLAAITPQQIIPQNVAPELSERATACKYPLIYVYCDKLVNELHEKFRTFSGEAQMVVEARVSQDRLEDIEANLHAYVDAIMQVLDQSRGDWGDGTFYGGGYEINFSGVKRGGRNFIEAAKISLTVEISAD